MPNATRPWQHVLEPIFGYISLAEKLYKDKKNNFSGAWNFAPSLKNNLKVKEVANFGREILQSRSRIIQSNQKFYESTNLSLSSTKAFTRLKWKNVLNARKALKMSFEWYKMFYNTKSKDVMIKYSFEQISSYLKISKILKI